MANGWATNQIFISTSHINPRPTPVVIVPNPIIHVHKFNRLRFPCFPALITESVLLFSRWRERAVGADQGSENTKAASVETYKKSELYLWPKTEIDILSNGTTERPIRCFNFSSRTMDWVQRIYCGNPPTRTHRIVLIRLPAHSNYNEARVGGHRIQCNANWLPKIQWWKSKDKMHERRRPPGWMWVSSCANLYRSNSSSLAAATVTLTFVTYG